jgi:V8-like Glu-specific endopeptidase
LTEVTTMPRRSVVAGFVLALVTALAEVPVVTQVPDSALARVAQAERELGEAVRGGVSGQIVQRVPGEFVFVPERRDLPSVPLAGASVDASKAQGLPVIVRGTVADGALTVQEFALKRPTLPSQLDGVLALNSERLLNAIDRAVKPSSVERLSETMSIISTMPSESAAPVLPRTVVGPGSPLDVQARVTLDQILSEYAKALQQNRASDARAVAQRWSELRRVVAPVMPIEHKAIYGDLDNYSPWRYEVIYQQSAAVVAIARPGDTTSFCSGVLITEEMVLSAAHCFAPERLPQQTEVWFRYVDGPGNPPPARFRRAVEGFAIASTPDAQKRLLEHRFGPDVLDYVIVRLAAAPQPAPIGVAAQCLRRSAPHKGDALYVVGYPLGQPAQVHDSARVYLPYRVLDGNEYLKLRLNVQADALLFPEHDDLMREFDASYRNVIEADGFKWRALHDIRAQGQPQMGIVADTFQGNSGGPVYERDRGQCVVGLLVQGATDTGRRREPNWKEHEHVLPMTSILDDLERSPAGQALVAKLLVQ